ncbi:MAG TPA: hypothetical protein VFG03_15860 [Telluria sp.]|nr:hypothetical protein [Telluria sp.]
MNAKKSGFVPYANEADVLQVGGLTIENRLDRISLHGDIDLTADQSGLAQARLLQGLLNDVVAALESQTLPASLPEPSIKTVANPFD